ncbi:MAG: nucleotidyltransferase [Synergistales bacterium]|nr:nucleotidyltransferase [Synergistales bacterium]
MIEYDKLKKALKHLELQFQNHLDLDDDQPELIKEAVVESVIQRFETCWDCMWKVLKRYLHEEIGLADVPNGPNPILRLAHENRLLPSPIENWLIYAKARVNTSHDYSGEKAQDAIKLMDGFIKDGISLYETMTKGTWR